MGMESAFISRVWDACYSDNTWPQWRLKWPATPLFVQLFARAIVNEDIKARHYWPYVQGIHPRKGPEK